MFPLVLPRSPLTLLRDQGWNQCKARGETVDSQTLKVGVVGNPPFVFYGEGKNAAFTGISLDVWRAVAESQKWNSEYVRQNSISAGITAVAEGELDILIGPISVTPERAAIEGITFTQPYFSSGIGLLIPGKPVSLWERFSPFFGIAALSSAGVLTLLLFLVGNLIWLAEHRKNPEQFSPITQKESKMACGLP
ncbi:transporter substrate-binding domain-containing protein [Synechocystis sp. B12]|nr:transporter substrate-binding domain-containing protein [Synechocystis sp. B12]